MEAIFTLMGVLHNGGLSEGAVTDRDWAPFSKGELFKDYCGNGLYNLNSNEDEPSDVTADYLDGMLALAKEMSIHADMIYDVVVGGCDEIDEAAKIYIKANKAKLAAVIDEFESTVDKVIKKESENDEK